MLHLYLFHSTVETNESADNGWASYSQSDATIGQKEIIPDDELEDIRSMINQIVNEPVSFSQDLFVLICCIIVSTETNENGSRSMLASRSINTQAS